MKKIIVPIVAVIAFATLAFAGENYFHTIKAEIGGFAQSLGAGTSNPSSAYALDVVGDSRVSGTENVGSLVATSFIRVASKTKAELAALTPASAGSLYYCSDCTAAASKLVISTGTAKASFAIITSSVTYPS